MLDVRTKTDYTTEINQVISEFFEKSIEEASAFDPSYVHLWQSMFSLIQSGGKRLRPKMTLMAYQAFGGQSVNDILTVAAAQELLHFSLLIHDDIIDRDYIRYGTANIAGQYKSIYSNHSSSDNLTHFANSAALLGGDLMISGAYQLINSSGLSDKDKLTAQKLLGVGIFEVAGGELLDSELSFMPYKDGDALKVAIYKTASYSFILPLLTGASIAGADPDQQTKLRDYARALGVAYQLTDDLLGIFGDESQTGKSTVSDIVEGKRTYLIEKALEVFSDAEKSTFMMVFGNHEATPLQIESVKQMLVSSGAKQRTEQKINDYINAALRSLEQLNLSSEYHKQFVEFASKVTNRVS